MADSSNTRLDARIEAAAVAHFESQATGARWSELMAADQATLRRRMTRALAASDAVERPAVERLVAALRNVANLNHFDGDDLHAPLFETCDAPECRQAREALAEFGQQPTGDEA